MKNVCPISTALCVLCSVMCFAVWADETLENDAHGRFFNGKRQVIHQPVCADAVQCRGRFVERVEGWTTNNWVFVPTMLYGGNRFRVIKEK